uniref:Ig-like domain-containing protein n=1 Tax=Romanomermis culicivorax TaxID=13658 RepID=A0A915I9W2_ROMCU
MASRFKDDYQLEDDDRVHIESYPDGKCRLRINDFMEMDASTYKCMATNELGSSSTSANLSVEAVREDEIAKKKEYAPRFVKDLIDLKVKQDDKPPQALFVFLLMFKNGIPIKLQDENIITETFDDGTCKLTLNKARESDMGAFRCLARNVHGSTNCACLLSVETSRPEKRKEGEGPIFLKGLSDCWVDKGSDVILKCQNIFAELIVVSYFDYKYKDGTLIRANDRLDLGYMDDGTVILTIRDSSISDEGFYRCSAENPFGEVSTIGTVRIQALTGRREVTIDEGEQPKFIIPLKDAKCSEGGRCEFECKVIGKPPPQYKDGSMLLTDYRCRLESLGDDRYRLSLDNITSRDEGNYRCVATNDSGAATSKATLSIDEG